MRLCLTATAAEQDSIQKSIEGSFAFTTNEADNIYECKSENNFDEHNIRLVYYSHDCCLLNFTGPTAFSLHKIRIQSDTSVAS